MKLHSRLSALMGEKRLSIQDVHQQTKLSRTTISNLYNDKATRIDFETIEKICSFFNCELNEILYFKKSIKENDRDGY